MMQPPGSRPGISALAISPASPPITIQPIMPCDPSMSIPSFNRSESAVNEPPTPVRITSAAVGRKKLLSAYASGQLPLLTYWANTVRDGSARDYRYGRLRE